jgi:hypothetical protein
MRPRRRLRPAARGLAGAIALNALASVVWAAASLPSPSVTASCGAPVATVAGYPTAPASQFLRD